ncbi:hypothetical protein C8T65DRAFT_542280, partial [Cerioporus squamosus]
SALSLMCPQKPYSLTDDVESFVHVFHLAVLRFHQTDVDNLHNFVHEKYDSFERVNATKIGGGRKILDFLTSRAPFRVVGNRSLQRVLDRLAKACHKSYKTMNFAEVICRYGAVEVE